MNKSLKTHLKPNGYAPEIITQGIWTHKNRNINSTLVVDDFGIKYRYKKYVYHLIAALRFKYEVTQYWILGLYCVITLKWNCTVRILEIYMSGYVKDAIKMFQHPAPTRPQHSLHQWISPSYGSTAPQLVQPTDNTPSLNYS